MNLTEEQLKMVEEMGKLFYGAKLIAFNIEVDPGELQMILDSEKGPIFSAYMKGYLTSDMNLRRSTLQAALNGSTPSIQQMENYKAHP